jgi:hypothetical protein
VSETTPELVINIRTERLLSLAQAARLFPSHKRDLPLHPSTLTRWILKGVLCGTGERIRLEALRVGYKWITSIEAVERFLARQQIANPTAVPPQSPNYRPAAWRRKASERAARAAAELEKLGV